MFYRGISLLFMSVEQGQVVHWFCMQSQIRVLALISDYLMSHSEILNVMVLYGLCSLMHMECGYKYMCIYLVSGAYVAKTHFRY